MTVLKNDVVRARVDSQLKNSAEAVLSEIGMSMGEAIRLFLTQVSLRHEFPVELKIPNKTTLTFILYSPSLIILCSCIKSFTKALFSLTLSLSTDSSFKLCLEEGNSKEVIKPFSPRVNL